MSRRDKTNEIISPLHERLSGSRSGGSGGSREKCSNGQHELASPRMSWRDGAVITPQQIEDERIKQMELESRKNSSTKASRHRESPRMSWRDGAVITPQQIEDERRKQIELEARQSSSARARQQPDYSPPKLKAATTTTIPETTRSTARIDGAGRMFPQHFQFKEHQGPSTTASSRQHKSGESTLRNEVLGGQHRKQPPQQKVAVPAIAAVAAGTKEAEDDTSFDSPYRPVRRYSSVRGAPATPVLTRDIEEARIKQREYDERQRTMASSQAAGRKPELQNDNQETMPLPTAYGERMETYWATAFDRINQGQDDIAVSNRNVQRQYQEQEKNGKNPPTEQFSRSSESIGGAPSAKLPRRGQEDVADEREEQSAPKSPVIGAIACHRATTQMLTKGRLALQPTLSIRNTQPHNHSKKNAEGSDHDIHQNEVPISRNNNDNSDNSITIDMEQDDCQDTTASGTMTAAYHSSTLRYDHVEIERESPNVNPPIDRQDAAGKQTNNSKLRLFLGGFSMILVVIVVIVIIIFVSKSNDDAGEVIPQDHGNDDHETVINFQEGLLDRLAFIIDDYTVFDDESSPQNKALSWLGTKDKTLQLLSSAEAGTGGDSYAANISNSTATSVNSRLATRYALAVLYYSTQGDTSWLVGGNKNSSFMSPLLHECDWKLNITENSQSVDGGVFCDEYNRVTQLQLCCNRLVGTLPQEISILSHLTVLNLGDNGLNGPIDPIWNLSKLTSLDLGLNQFSSTLPIMMGQDLRGLKLLRLDGNRLEGSIPQSFSFLANLKYLDVSKNMLTSPSFGAESIWGNMTELKILDMAGNLISGTLPASFMSSLSSLEVFHFSNNFISGSIPAQIASLQSLLSLSGRNNNLQGPIPWGNISPNALSEVDLSSNSLTGEPLPSDIGLFSKLKELQLSNNLDFWESSIPESIGELSQLETLDLSTTRLTGELPSKLGGMSALTALDVSSNILEGSLKTDLANLQSLIELRLDSNRFSGSVPMEFLQLTSLKHVSMFANDLSGDVGFLCTLANDSDMQDSDSVQDTCETIAVGYTEQGVFENRLECTEPCCLDATSFRRRAHNCQF